MYVTKIERISLNWKGCEEMALIKLFSGMDFSGKSTTVKNLSIAMPGKFKCQQKFITPIKTLQEMIDNNIWVPCKDFIPMLQEMVITDVRDYYQKDIILQDTLWVIKFTAKLLADGKIIYETEIKKLLSLIKNYPDMDSFYITASMEKRKDRYQKRLLNGERISRSDRLLFSGNIFEEIEKYYKEIIFSRFPDTRIIDTTNQSPSQIVEILKNDTAIKYN
mgnify:CR=1 FL=1